MGETAAQIGVVFQNSVLDRALSVKENLKCRAALYGISGSEFKARLDELSQILDFKDLLSRPVGKLSGGQRRRIDIARALFHKPQILILDEPTTGLDPQTRRLIWQTVSELQKLDGVDSVRDNRDIAQTLVRIRRTIFYVSIGVIAVLLLISLFIIANTVRITMYSRRLEINIMKSVGATNWFIRWPFMVEGMVLGAISGVLSLAIVWGVYRALQSTVTQMLTMVSRGFTIVPFTDYVVYLLVAFLAIGIVSGGIGSLISIQKYLKERGGVVYEETE